MSEHVFPDNKTDALALIYVQSRDLTNLTAAELLDLYEKTRKEIKEYAAKRRAATAKALKAGRLTPSLLAALYHFK